MADNGEAVNRESWIFTIWTYMADNPGELYMYLNIQLKVLNN